MKNSHQEPLKKGGFTFKRFFVAHDKSPMQVTTDSCLLGAWAPIDHHPQKILDIGTGCGVIALMLAQRLAHNLCQIDAIDINADAIKQCQENSMHAGLPSVRAQQADINKFGLNLVACYDLIVTNPPYFEPAVDCRNSQRQLARYTESLNFEQLINSVKRLLKPDGLFGLVLPFHMAEQFICLCKANQLFLQQELYVKYNANKNFSLSLLAFSLTNSGQVLSEQLCMRDDDGRYSSAFRQLLNDFYLFRK